MRDRTSVFIETSKRISRQSVLALAVAGFAGGCSGTQGQGCGPTPNAGSPTAVQPAMKCGPGTTLNATNQCVPENAATTTPPQYQTSTPESIAAHQAALGYNSDGTCPRGTSPNPYDPPSQRRCMTSADANREQLSRRNSGK